MKLCQHCGQRMERPRNLSLPSWYRRKFCSQKCNGLARAVHGEAWKTPEYAIWQAMVQRCSNPSSKNWHRYGARGIFVCKTWLSYQNFLKDMGRRLSPRHSIERRDNDDGYNPRNCYWADPGTQANNKRSNVILTHNGRSLTIAQWSKEIGIRQNTIVYRLRRGWSVERTLSEPLQSMHAHQRVHE